MAAGIRYVGASRMTIQPFRALRSSHEDQGIPEDLNLTLFASIRGSALLSINASNVADIWIFDHFGHV